MSSLQVQIMQSIISMPEDKLKVIFENIQQLIGPAAGKGAGDGSTADIFSSKAGGVRIGLFEGMKYIADGHDIDECNDDIAGLFGVNS